MNRHLDMFLFRFHIRTAEWLRRWTMSIAFFLRLKNLTASSTTSDGHRSIGNKLEILAALAAANSLCHLPLVLLLLDRYSKHLHEKMLKAVLHTPVRFFDINPNEAIQNRISKDIAIMDDFLPRHLATAMTLVAFFTGMLVLTSISYPWLILGTIPCVLLTVYVGSKGFNSGREIKRTEASALLSYFFARRFSRCASTTN